jgi:hypothetical protein
MPRTQADFNASLRAEIAADAEPDEAFLKRPMLVTGEKHSDQARTYQFKMDLPEEAAILKAKLSFKLGWKRRRTG